VNSTSPRLSTVLLPAASTGAKHEHICGGEQ
jgi:hypothetical protein